MDINEKTDAIQNLAEWQMPFSEVLHHYLQEIPYEYHSGWRFILKDLNHDGIPELIVTGNQGILSDVVAIYAFEREVVPIVLAQPLWFAFYIPHLSEETSGFFSLSSSDGIGTFNDYENASSTSLTLSVVEENQLVAKTTALKVSIIGNMESETFLYFNEWYLNGQQVTEEEFHRIVNETFGDWDELTNTFGTVPYDLTPENIQSVIFNWQP